MTDQCQESDCSIKIGYPCDDSSTVEIPEGINLEKSEPLETVRIYPLEQNKKIYERLISVSRFIQFCSIIDFLICTLYLLNKSELSGLVMALPLFGYCGAKYFNRGLVSMYGIYLILGLLAKIHQIYICWPLSMIFGIIITCAFNISLLGAIIFFYVQLCRITKEERKILRVAFNLNQA